MTIPPKCPICGADGGTDGHAIDALGNVVHPQITCGCGERATDFSIEAPVCDSFPKCHLDLRKTRIQPRLLALEELIADCANDISHDKERIVTPPPTRQTVIWRCRPNCKKCRIEAVLNSRQDVPTRNYVTVKHRLPSQVYAAPVKTSICPECRSGDPDKYPMDDAGFVTLCEHPFHNGGSL